MGKAYASATQMEDQLFSDTRWLTDCVSVFPNERASCLHCICLFGSLAIFCSICFIQIRSWKRWMFLQYERALWVSVQCEPPGSQGLESQVSEVVFLRIKFMYGWWNYMKINQDYCSSLNEFKTWEWICCIHLSVTELILNIKYKLNSVHPVNVVRKVAAKTSQVLHNFNMMVIVRKIYLLAFLVMFVPSGTRSSLAIFWQWFVRPN